MIRLIRAELIRLRGAPSTWWLVAFAHVAVVFGMVLTLALVDIRTHADALSVVSFSGVAGQVLLLLGLVWTAGTYRHRTVIPAMLHAPRRIPPFAAQLLALAVVGVLVGLSAAALAVVLTLGWFGLADVSVELTAGEIAKVWPGTALYSGLAAALGGGLGRPSAIRWPPPSRSSSISGWLIRSSAWPFPATASSPRPRSERC